MSGLFVEFLQRLEGDLMAAVAPPPGHTRSTSCASEEKALRPQGGGEVALISTFFIVMLQGSQREVRLGFGVKDVTLVEIKGEQTLRFSPLAIIGFASSDGTRAVSS